MGRTGAGKSRHGHGFCILLPAHGAGIARGTGQGQHREWGRDGTGSGAGTARGAGRLQPVLPLHCSSSVFGTQQSAGAETRAAHPGQLPGPCVGCAGLHARVPPAPGATSLLHQGRGQERGCCSRSDPRAAGGRGLGPAAFTAKSAPGVLIRQRLLLDTWHLLTDYCCH